MAIMRINGNNFATKGDGSIRIFDCVGIKKDGEWITSFYGEKDVAKPYHVLEALKDDIDFSEEIISIYPDHGVLLFLAEVFTNQDFYRSIEIDDEIELIGTINGTKKTFKIEKK